MSISIDQLAADLRLAGDVTRLKILEQLLQRGHTSSELADLLLMDPEEVDRHLGRLKRAGWIDTDERSVYRIRDRGRVARIQRAAPEILPGVPGLPED